MCGSSICPVPRSAARSPRTTSHQNAGRQYPSLGGNRPVARSAATKDLLQYLATFEHTLAVMQTAESIDRVAAEAVVEAVQAGFRRGESEVAHDGTAIRVNTIVCAMRTEPRSLEIAKLAVAMRDRDEYVVAFDLAGAETGWPPSLHQPALEHIRRNQMHLTIHASEPPDIELITDALALGAERIGHGVRLLADCRDVDFATGSMRMGRVATAILERQVPLELAPTCNVQIGAVSSIGHHPIGPFLRAGFRVNINTDNRLMSNVSVSSEVHAVTQAFSLSRAEVGRVALNGIDASFGEWAERQQIRRELMAAYA